MRLRLIRLLRLAAVVWLAWLLIGNLVLNTALGPTLINRKPDKFQMHWGRAFTLWPGQAWLWDLRCQGHTRRIVWQAQAERASGRLALWPLLRKQLRIPAIRAHGVQAQFDHVEQDLLPPPPRPGGWTLRFDAITSGSVRTVRVGDLLLEGEGAATVGVRKQLRGGPLEILPSSAHMSGARLRNGDAQWLANGRLDVDFVLPSHRRDRAPGLSRLGLAGAHVVLSGDLPGLTVALDERGRWATQLAALSATDKPGTRGRVDVDLRLDRGALVSGGRLALTAPLAAIDAQGDTWTGQGVLDAQIGEDITLRLRLPPPPGDGGRIEADLHLAGRSLPFACSEPAAAEAALGPTCAFDPDLHAQLHRLAGTAALRWHFDSLAWLGPLLARAPWLHLDGSGEVDADLRIAGGELAAGSRLTVPELDLRLAVLDNHIEGRARAQAVITAAAEGTRTEVALTVEQFQMRPSDAPDQVYVRGRNLRLDLDAGGHLATLRDSLSARLRFSGADVPDLTVYNRYLPHDGLRLLAGRGTLGGDLHLDAAGEVGQGRLDIGARGARLRVGEVELDGDIALATHLRRADLAHRSFDLDGTTLALTRVRVRDNGRTRVADWWARARLDRGHVAWGRPLTMDARASARARDASVLLELFARQRDYPRWVLGLVDAGEARVEGRVRMGGPALVLDPLHAANDRFDMKARLRIADRRPRGDLLLVWRRLSLGLELAGGERHWHLRKAADWFAGRSLPP